MTAVENGFEVARVLALARTHLGMDVAIISQFRDGKQIYLAAAGDADSFGIELEDGPAREETFCHRLVKGLIPPVIPDTSANEHVADLAVTRDNAIGAYVGVPLAFADGEVYGTFCCLSHRPDPALNDRDARFMAMLGDILIAQLQEGEQRRRQRERLLDVAIREDFAIALQPVVSVTTGRLVGAEALTRFPADLGPPDLAFGQAHGLGVGVELEAAAFRKSRGLTERLPETAYLAMNMSPSALMAPAMRSVFDLLPDPGRCVLELTEHVSVDEYKALTDIIEPLRAMGIRLAVDDVGAGYASFHHVLELRPDIIKIDRSLVSGAARDGARRRIITSITLLAMDLGASVVAEGVETQDDLRAVAELGVDSAQGYLVAPPTTNRDEIARWSQPWHIHTLADADAQALRREAFAKALRQLRGERRQVDILRSVNAALEAAGEGARISQGQYSAYEHGRERPNRVRVAALENVFGLAAGTLAAILYNDVDTAAGASGPGAGNLTIAARLAETRRAARTI